MTTVINYPLCEVGNEETLATDPEVNLEAIVVRLETRQ